MKTPRRTDEYRVAVACIEISLDDVESMRTSHAGALPTPYELQWVARQVVDVLGRRPTHGEWCMGLGAPYGVLRDTLDVMGCVGEN